MEAKWTCQITEFANKWDYYDTTAEFTEFDNDWEPKEHIKSSNFQLGGTSVLKLLITHILGIERESNTYVKSY